MLEEWRETLDSNFFVTAVLTDFSKDFGCLPHDLLIAKFSTCGFGNDSLCYIYSYLKKWKQCVRINNPKSGFEYIVSGVPQNSILGPISHEILLTIFSVAFQKLQFIILQMITPCFLHAYLRTSLYFGIRI